MNEHELRNGLEFFNQHIIGFVGGGRCITMPTPRALSFHVIYVVEAE